jgi:hypothetical protein
MQYGSGTNFSLPFRISSSLGLFAMQQSQPLMCALSETQACLQDALRNAQHALAADCGVPFAEAHREPLAVTLYSRAQSSVALCLAIHLPTIGAAVRELVNMGNEDASTRSLSLQQEGDKVLHEEGLRVLEQVNGFGCWIVLPPFKKLCGTTMHCLLCCRRCLSPCQPRTSNALR